MTESATAANALNDLLTSVSSLSLSQISGKTVTLNTQSYDFDTPITFSNAEKSFTYSLISLFLQLQNPSINFIEYKKLCKEYDAKDFVKVTEKKHALGFFLKDGEGGSGKKVRISAGGDSYEGKDSDKSKADRDRGRTPQKDRHGRSSKPKRSRDESIGDGSAKKKEKKEETSAPITHQQLLQQLETVVVKRKGNVNNAKQTGNDNPEARRSEKGTNENEESNENSSSVLNDSTEDPPLLLSQEEEERRAIQACLSSTGYEASNFSEEILEKDRIEVEKITSFEIPVGDSGSILRCGALSTNTPQTSGRKRGVSDALTQKNFKRVLELFEESKKEEMYKMKHGSKHSSKHSKVKVQEKIKPAGNPIIIVPNAMTSPITLINSYQFLKKATFLPRQKCQRIKESSIQLTRNVSNRLGGGSITYEIIDNPKRRLKSPADWARVVAVIAQGESWQFKGWRMGWEDSKKGNDASKKGNDTPVEVFSKCFGFYVGFEGAPIPAELEGWNVKKGFLSKDKRGLDSVVFAQFWNHLEEYLSVKKPEFLPK